MYSTETLTLYDEDGDEVEVFESGSCPCTIPLTPRPMLAVKVAAGGEDKGFVM